MEPSAVSAGSENPVRVWMWQGLPDRAGSLGPRDPSPPCPPSFKKLLFAARNRDVQAGANVWEWPVLIKIHTEGRRIFLGIQEQHLSAVTSGRNRGQEQDRQWVPRHQSLVPPLSWSHLLSLGICSIFQLVPTPVRTRASCVPITLAHCSHLPAQPHAPLSVPGACCSVFPRGI